MPPRYSYWTILAGGLPTAFRAADREDLLPTFRRVKSTQPDAELKWFARGRLWASPEEAAAAAAPTSPARGRDWRPGGLHKDPRQPYKDAKKDRNLRARKERFERRSGPPSSAQSSWTPKPAWSPKPPKPSFGSGEPRATSRPPRDGHLADRASVDRPSWNRRPAGARPQDRRPEDGRSERRPQNRRPEDGREDRRPWDRRPPERRSDDRQPSERREHRPPDRQRTDRPREDRPREDRHRDERPREDRRPAEHRPANRRPGPPRGKPRR